MSAGGNVTVEWTLEKALAAGDRATGVPVLEELYARMRKPFSAFDLDATFRQLGIGGVEAGVARRRCSPTGRGAPGDRHRQVTPGSHRPGIGAREAGHDGTASSSLHDGPPT